LASGPAARSRVFLTAILVLVSLVLVPLALCAQDCEGVCDGRWCLVPETGAGGNCLIQPGGCACVPEVTPTATPVVGQCEGDCDGDGAVRINELILSVNIGLGIAPPSSCPAGQCSDGPPIAVSCTIRAVNNALAGCPTAAAEPTRTATPSQAVSPQPTATPSPPELSLAVRAVPLPDEGRVEITAELLHLGGSAVWYLAGCSALCRPALYRAISFYIVGPDGEEVIIDDPCVGPLFCAEYLEELAPDTSRTQTASVTGTAWVEGESNFQCYGCTTTLLATGHYTVVASFVYRLGQSFADPIQPALTATAGFDWPPVAEP